MPHPITRTAYAVLAATLTGLGCGGAHIGLGADMLPTSCKLTDPPEALDTATSKLRCKIVRYEADHQEATVMSDDRGYQTNGIPAYWLEEATAGAVLNLQFPETERPPAEGSTLEVMVNKLVVRPGTRRGS